MSDETRTLTFEELKEAFNESKRLLGICWGDLGLCYCEAPKLQGEITKLRGEIDWFWRTYVRLPDEFVDPTFIRDHERSTAYTTQWHHEPCGVCSMAAPWNRGYETCPIHSTLSCNCDAINRDDSFQNYCERHGHSWKHIKEETKYCDECHAHTSHKLTSSKFIGCDGGVGGEECKVCGHGEWYI